MATTLVDRLCEHRSFLSSMRVVRTHTEREGAGEQIQGYAFDVEATDEP